MASDLRAVGPEFLDTAPHRFTYSAVIRQSPERVFDAVADHPERLGDWYPGFDHTGQWLTDGEPEAGSRRRVRMARITYEDTILTWEPPARFAFRVDRAGLPLAHALAEGYRIGPHPSGATLEWVFTIEPYALFRPLVAGFDLVLSRLFERASTNLEKHLRS